MTTPPESAGRVRFGPFVVDPATGELWKDGAPLHVQDLPFRLLVALLERPGELVTRAELAQKLWGTETHVDSAAGLNTAVAKLREALADDAAEPVWVETVPKRGYRFLAEIEGASVTAPAPRSSSRWLRWVPLAAIVTAAAAFLLLEPASEPKLRVAVVLFDNETDDPGLDRVAQGLTDATVFELTARPELDVIGNAAILRTARPFRDLEAVRDATDADFIVLGQVQTVDRALHVRAHLIRAADLAHVWVDDFPATAAGEAALQADVAGRITAAVAERAASETAPSADAP
jgi:DNA-binding winged helix-turn-helix (wHTH) protein/TolB-like protein